MSPLGGYSGQDSWNSMQLKVDERSYLTLVHLGGRVGAEARHKLWSTIDEVFRSDPLAVLWDLSDLDELHDWALSVLAGAITYQRVKNMPVVMVSPPQELADRLRASGAFFDVAMVTDESEASVALLERIPKKYDEFFCKVVVEEGLIDAAKLKQGLLQFEREGRAGDFGRLLLREGLMTAPQLLEAVARQKTLLGDILVEGGALASEDLEEALLRHQGAGEKIGDLLLRLGLATNEDIYQALKRQFKKRQRFQKPSEKEPEATPEEAARSARLGEILLEKRLLTKEDLDRSLQLQKQTRGREKLGDILVRLGFVNDSELYKALLTQYQRSQGGEEMSGEVKAALEVLIGRLGNSDYLAFRNAMEGLMALGGPAFSVVTASLRNPSPPIRRGAADVLGSAMCVEALPALIERIEDPIPRVRQECYWSLLRISGQGFAIDDSAGWSQWWSSIDPRSLPKAPARLSSHREEMARMLATALEEGRALDAFDIEYRAGQAEWEGGHSRLQIRGDGLVQVFHTQRGETSTYLGTLGADEMRELFSGFSSAGILFIDSARTADDPGESRHELALRVGNQYYRRSLLYYRELFQNWTFRSYETKLRDLIRRVSRGAVL